MGDIRNDLYRTTKWLISDDEMAYFGWRNGLFRVLKSPLSGVNTAEAANVTCDMWHLACSQVSEKWKGRISYNIIFYIIYIIYNIYNISFQISQIENSLNVTCHMSHSREAAIFLLEITLSHQHYFVSLHTKLVN